MAGLVRRNISNGRGELYIDNRMSPIALPLSRDGEEWNVIKVGEKFERMTYSCAHCQRVVVKHPERTRPREWCPRCNGYLCEQPCNAQQECLDIRRLVEIQQANPNLDVLGLAFGGGNLAALQVLIDARKPHMGGGVTLAIEAREARFAAQQAQGAARLAGGKEKANG